MILKTKKVIESIAFTEWEEDFMKTLAETIQEECGNHDSCETCPFTEFTPNLCYCSCTDFIKFLKAFADPESITRDE